MKDITTQMFLFKEAVRHSWNTHFAGNNAPESTEAQDDFSKIEQSLFRTLVLVPCGLKGKTEEYRAAPIPWLIVRPRPGLSEWPVQFGVRENGNMIWRARENLPSLKNVVAEFYDFFDWAPYGYIDLAYVRARVVDARLIASKGSLVFIEHLHCEFYIKE